MKTILIVVAVLCAMVASATEKPAVRKAAAKPAARATAKPQSPAIPVDAVRVAENTYRHTDGQGKTWYYRRTPFGVTRSEQAPETAPQLSNQIARERQSPFAAEQTGAAPASQMQDAEMVSATETEDAVTFERATPFGKSSWTRKKSELTADEKALWERAKQNRAK